MHFPVDARGLSLKILATVAAIFALSAGHSFFIPLVFGIFLAYTLNPVVKWLERCHVPRLIGIAFNCQEVPAVPDEPHDVIVPEILTESGLRRFGPPL